MPDASPPLAGPPRPRTAGPRPVLRSRNFSRLFFGGIASVGGASIGETSLIWIIFSTTHSAIDVALYGVAFVVAGVAVSLFAGVLVDRFNRRRLMILADLARAASLALLFGGLLLFGFHLLFILGAVAVVAAFSTLFMPAQNALVPLVVPGESLADANGLIQSSNAVVQFGGNSVAGLLIAGVGAVVGLGLNSITFLVSALFVATVVLPAVTPAQSAAALARRSQSYLADLREGFQYLRKNVGLLELTVFAGIGNFFFSMIFAFWVVYATGPLRSGATTFGLLLGLFALGSGVGSLLVARVGAVRYTGRLWIAAGIAQGAGVLVLAFFPNLPTALSVVAGIGVSLGLVNTAWLSTVQLTVPTELQGRYFGIDQVGSFAIIPIAQVVGAFLIQADGILTNFTIAGFGLLGTGVAFLFARDLREFRHVPGGSPGASAPREPLPEVER